MATNDSTFWQKYFNRSFWHDKYWFGKFVKQVIKNIEMDNFRHKGQSAQLDGEGSTAIRVVHSGASSDAFGRVRISQPHTTFQALLEYGLNADFYDQSLSGGASVIHVPSKSAAELSCGTAQGDKVIRQSAYYSHYQPGKSQLVMCTGVLGEAKVGVRARIGYFDDNNGLFFEVTDGGIYAVRRSSTSGSPIDERVPQSEWNIDTFNGSKDFKNPAQGDIDSANAQIFLIDFEWLGAGRARMGFVIDGSIVYCREFLAANILTEPYMSTPNLPIRYELENTSSSASATNMLQICGTVISEGGVSRQGVIHSVASDPITVGTTEIPILSVRPKSLVNGIANKSISYPTSLSILNEGNSTIEYHVRLNGVLVGSSFGDVNADSTMERDIAATGITNGIDKYIGYIGASNAGKPDSIVSQEEDLRLSTHLDGSQDVITVTAKTFSGTTTVNASLSWREIL